MLRGKQKVKMEGSASGIGNNKVGLQARKHCGKGRTADEGLKRDCGAFRAQREAGWDGIPLLVWASSLADA